MNKLLDLISIVVSKHDDISQRITNRLKDIENELASVDAVIDQQNMKLDISVKADETENDFSHKRNQLQTERESLLRIKGNLYQFFVEEWTEIKVAVTSLEAQRNQEEKELNKKLEKIRIRIKSLKDEESDIQTQILRNKEVYPFEYILPILQYMPANIDMSKLSKQPRYLQDEILSCLLHDRTLPERLKNLIKGD